jgi:putative hydrolase of HD superfamily
VSGERLRRQIEFILEVDRAKQVLRRSRIVGRSRYENDAEHMWHVALAAMVLAEHVNEDVDLNKVITMLLVHDIVEIDAGDAFLYDVDGRAAKEDAERAAAERIFGLLPDDQGDDFRTLWEEYEAQATIEARFASAVDRLLPLLLNFATEGSTWKEHSITAEQVLELNVAWIGHGSAALSTYAKTLVEESVALGYL